VSRYIGVLAEGGTPPIADFLAETIRDQADRL
jgi:hypothetical protein